MDLEDSDDLFSSTFTNVIDNLEPSLHTLKQRRWRANRKDKPYSAHLTLPIVPNEQINEQDLYLSSIDESSEDDLTAPVDKNLEDDLITLDDINYDFNLNQGFVESTERFIEHELDEPLYDGAPVTFKSYHKQILEFGNSVRLNDSDMNKLLKLIGNALPIGHKLLNTNKKVVSIFQKTSSFNDILRCSNCLQIINNNNYCSLICEKNKCQRQVLDVIEHISVDRSNTQLIEIIRRNKHLILNYPEVVDKLLPCDVMTRLIYQDKRNYLQTTSIDTYPITLMLHIDGAPIVRWAKKHTWLVTASIVEIPPPLRENQFNLLLLSLWNGPITPNPDLLLKEVCDTIKQTLIVDDIRFSVDVLLFKADLPARALATKHVHHNGYFGCLECDQRGEWCEDGRIVVYPYTQNSVNLRTPTHFDICAKMVDGQTSVNNYYGVKGFSPLGKIMDIPTQIDLDVMHLCFIGHCSLLLSKWEKIITKQAWLSGNDFLKKVKWPHNFNVELHSFVERTHWKAHDYRAFFLYLMFPFVFSFFPDYISSHFSLYFVFIRTLYFYHDFNEVLEVEPLIKLYYQHALTIYGLPFYLYSTHAHLHLVEKVTSHGALCFHNCFGNEGFIRFIRSLRSGNRLIARQICRSFDRSRCTIAKETLSINNIFTDEKLIVDEYLDEQYILRYRLQFLNSVENVIDSTDNVCFFCRASRGISQFHSLSYRRRGNTQSFVVSFYDNKNNKCYGQVIFFYKLFGVSYAFLNMYDTTITYFSSNNFVNSWSFSPIVTKFLDKYYAKGELSDTKFVSIPFSSILYKCIVICMSGQTLLSEIFYDSDQS